MTNKNGIGIFDPEINSINFFQEKFHMRDDRKFYAALLIRTCKMKIKQNKKVSVHISIK